MRSISCALPMLSNSQHGQPEIRRRDHQGTDRREEQTDTRSDNAPDIDIGSHGAIAPEFATFRGDAERHLNVVIFTVVSY